MASTSFAFPKMSATTAAVHPSITSKTLGVALTNAWCPHLLYSSKNRHCVARPSNQRLKLDAVAKKPTAAPHRKPLPCEGSTRRAASSPHRLSVVAVSDQDEALPQSEDIPSVKVKFVMQKECRFGQKFGVVGEDILLGSWDPKKAFDLEWSVDHTWIGEVDLPVQKKYEFKFVLIEEDGGVHWQPGPNCTFETSDTTSSLVVSEPWFPEEPDKVVDEPLDVAEALNVLEDKEASDLDAEIENVQEIVDEKPPSDLDAEIQEAKEIADEKPHLFESGNNFAVAAPIDMAVALENALSSGKTEKQKS